MGRGNRNPGCTCCFVECSVFSDDFNRSDSTNVGSDWYESLGDWEIAFNQLRTDDANAVCLHQDDGNKNQYIAVQIQGATNDVFRVLLRASEDDYVFVEVTIGATTSTVTVNNRYGGAETQYGPTWTTPGIYNAQPFWLYCCYDDSNNVVTWSHDLWAVFAPVAWRTTPTIHRSYGQAQITADIPDDTVAIYYGVGTGSTMGTAKFDQFTVEEVSYPCRDCDQCLVFSDHFNELSSTWWSQEAGDWEARSSGRDKWIQTSDDDALLICQSENSIGESDSRVTFLITLLEVGDELKVIVDYVDSSNYHYVLITQGGYGEPNHFGQREYIIGSVKFMRMESGTATQYGATRAVGAFAAIGVCFDYGYRLFSLDAYLPGSGPAPIGQVHPFPDLHGGAKVGFGTGSIGNTLQVRDFQYRVRPYGPYRIPDPPYRSSNVYPGGLCGWCYYQCMWSCEGGYAPMLLRLTVAGVTNLPGSNCTTADDINGTYILRWTPQSQVTSGPGWWGWGGSDCTWMYDLDRDSTTCSEIYRWKFQYRMEWQLGANTVISYHIGGWAAQDPAGDDVGLVLATTRDQQHWPHDLNLDVPRHNCMEDTIVMQFRPGQDWWTRYNVSIDNAIFTIEPIPQ